MQTMRKASGAGTAQEAKAVLLRRLPHGVVELASRTGKAGILSYRDVRFMWMFVRILRRHKPQVLFSRLLCGVQDTEGMIMGVDHIKRVNAYLLAMTTADKMRREGVISNEDYQRIEPLILAKYGLFSRSIYRRNDWIISRPRVNITPTKRR